VEHRNLASAARYTALTFGILAGLGGLTHGIGEALQGNVRPSGIIIESWMRGPIATHMGGEPGMTIVPNLLATGILTILVSLAIVVWSLLVRDRNGGRILIGLSVVMLLAGGGFGPPIIGILAGVAGTTIGRPSHRWRKRMRAGVWRTLGALWPAVFGIAALNGVFLVIGSVVLVVFFDLNNPDLFTNSFFLSILSLAVTIVISRAYDSGRTPAAR
jgi:hypothetical protein